MKNVILLAMSRLGENGFFAELSDIFEDNTLLGMNEKITDCSSQLEPVVKKLLKQKNVTDLEIVVLCTRATIDDKVNIKATLGTEYKCSALDYFVMRIYGAIFNKEIFAENVSDDWKKLNKEKYIEEFDIDKNNADKNAYVSYGEKEKKLRITRILIDEKRILAGVDYAVDYLENILKNDNIESESDSGIEGFWVDTHGGFKDMVMVCNMIISCLQLKNENYVPDEIYGIHYAKQGPTIKTSIVKRLKKLAPGAGDKLEENNETHRSQIVSQREIYDIYTVSSGMENFVQHGDAALLVLYFVNAGIDENIINAMQMMSDGLKECNLKMFLNGTSKLKENLNRLDNFDNMQVFFKEYILNELAILIKENVTVVDVIRYCMEKGMYQQALTFMDIGIPSYLFNQKYVYYKGIFIDGQREENEEQINRIFSALKKKESKMYMSDVDYVFDRLFQRDIENGDKNQQRYVYENVYASASKQMNIGKIMSKNAYVRWEISEAAFNLLKVHMDMKDYRNCVSYANADKQDVKRIVREMKNYVSLLMNMKKY